ncbi:hypothetical protein JCM19240_5025 [Vibrio maritimus]|uniref:Uncharacterized protein n=1 Tax=Vibrio maritimus TaxID=990268 RepID=A0A090SYP9_9VIBR|nr:hypothetical protein JCM19240_5025 [Vibrio maritimus]
MKLKQTALGVALVLLAGSAAATSLDYRAEYKHEDEKYAHRIKIGDSTKAFDGKLAFGVEQKFNSEDQKDFWNKVVRGDSEFSWAWTKSVGETGKWYIQPGMPITFAKDKTTYKPQFRVGYKADFGLTTALRYRHELQVFAESADQKTLVDGGKLDVAGNTVQQGKWTLTGSYKFSQESLKTLSLATRQTLTTTTTMFVSRTTKTGNGILALKLVTRLMPSNLMLNFGQSTKAHLLKTIVS